jgi:hypothetical protein
VGHSPEAALLAGLDESTRAGIAGELNTAGITDDAGTVRRQWLQVLGQAATAPIRVSLVSRSGGSRHIAGWTSLKAAASPSDFRARSSAPRTRQTNPRAPSRLTGMTRRLRRS